MALAIAAVSVAACGDQAVQKSGARVDRAVTLTLEMPDQGDQLGIAFAAAVARRSNGSVQLKLGNGYSGALPANELRLVRALEAGRADVAYVPARAWSAAGLPEFRALLAPFVLTTDKAAQALASSKLGRDVLATLPHDVVGLALVPAQTRRVLADRPPLTPADFSRLRLRIVDDPQSAATFEALGAQAIQGLSARDVNRALEHDRLDAAESAPVHIAENSYWNQLRHLSGYGIFPKFESIAMSRRAWRRLSKAQQAAMREAAAETVRSARTGIPDQERSDLSVLCAAGVRIAVPSAQQLRALAQATQPALAALESNPAAARVLDAMRILPGAGPQPLAAPLPAACTPGGSEDQAARSAFPEGVYVAKVTAAQFRAAGAPVPYDEDTVFTTTFRRGRWTQTVTPTLPDQCADVPTPSHPACSGSYHVDGNRLTLVWEPPTPPPLPAPETMEFSYFDGVLRFEPADVTGAGERVILRQPWRKVR
ncbi:TRAP transporter substrate-binding protein DctP [Solirubrobacter ginsenosidimutans]|uniref:TRAP transporter substrate-binding protein DctP n=1 Tax=Solirubrobacter ginsenosidimutans TaxID=490573 RepID=A0A9X3MMF2_9ACTN|nr:TRAP transporter substrate-binding protein DctP [Solirubrobacter ginsenosidimutans]MDA0158832.1 TRAP transporter substrate-binding protein DctP [Solirubrobacter ginsenosidimutans]